MTRDLVICVMFVAAALLSQSDAESSLRNAKLNRPNNSENLKGVVEINNEIFYINTEEVSWYVAKTQCNLLGMQLVTLDSKERSDMILNFFQQNIEYDWWTWTSGQKVSGQTDFMWTTTGENFTYTNWGMNAPTVSTTNEACMNVIGRHGGWFDDFCYVYLQYMCEAVPSV